MTKGLTILALLQHSPKELDRLNFEYFIYIGVGLLILLLAVKSSAIRSWYGQFRVNRDIQSLVDSSDYHVMQDVILLTFEGLVHIDLIIISRFGLFVIYANDLPGVIVPSDVEDLWLQESGKNETRSFPNPSIQAKKNAHTLKILTGLSSSDIIPIVLFRKCAKFKHKTLRNIVRGPDFLTYVYSKSDLLLTTSQIRDAVKAIEAKRKKQGLMPGMKHIDLSKQTKSILDYDEKCPVCKSPMEICTVDGKRNQKKQILRCVLHPTCLGTRNK